MINDARRAYFYAKITRDVYIELPKEDPKFGTGLLGKLKLCLYGTRDAAKGWQETLSAHLVGIGFVRGKGHPCVPSPLETVQIPNSLNPCILIDREKPQEDWFRIHESSLLQFARQVLRLPNSSSTEVFSSDDIAQALISTFSIENELVVG